MLSYPAIPKVMLHNKQPQSVSDFQRDYSQAHVLKVDTVGPAPESRMGMDGWVVYLFGLGSSLPQIFLIFLAQLLSRAYFSSGEW